MKESGNKINLVLKLDHPWIALNHFRVSHLNMKNNKTAKKECILSKNVPSFTFTQQVWNWQMLEYLGFPQIKKRYTKAAQSKDICSNDVRQWFSLKRQALELRSLFESWQFCRLNWKQK